MKSNLAVDADVRAARRRVPMVRRLPSTLELMKVALTCFAAVFICIRLAFAAVVLPEGEAEFRELVQSQAPIGTPVEIAKERMKALGLRCAPAKGWTGNIRDTTEFYFCSFQVGRLVARRWQVGLLPREGRIVDVVARVGLVGP